MPTLPNQELTTREREFLLAYRKHKEEHGFEPSMPVMARTLGIVVRAAQLIRDGLVTKGYVTRIEPPKWAQKNTLVRLKFTAKAKKAIG